MLAVRSLRVVLLYALLALVVFGVVWSYPRGDKTMDLGSFIASGQAASHHLNPYAAYDLTVKFRAGDVSGNAINRNPPVSIPIFQALSRFDPIASFRVWYFVSLAFYLAAVAVLCRTYPRYATSLRIAWALGLAGVWSTVNLGQIYMPLVLTSTAAYVLLQQRRHVFAGVFIGALIAIKPNFLVWPVLLLIAGAWTTALTALVFAGTASLIPAIVYGPRIYLQWAQTFSSHPWISYPTNGSLFGLMDRLGAPWLGVAVSGLLLVALALLTWRRRVPTTLVSDFALLGSLLASPEAWTGYTLFLLPVFFRRPWGPIMVCAAGLLMVPETLILEWSKLSTWHFAVFANLDNVALLALLPAVVRDALGSVENAQIPNGSPSSVAGADESVESSPVLVESLGEPP